MDTPTSAALDEKTASSEQLVATQPGKEKSNPSSPLEINAERFNSSVARLTTNSIDELHKLAFELQKMQEFLKTEVESVQRQIDSAVAGINIHRRNDWPVEKHGGLPNTSIRHSQRPRGGTGGQH
jgi:hypothetical protein